MDVESLEARLGYHFQRAELLELALTHRSTAADAQGSGSVAHNERLEFLGDAVLELVASESLVQYFPEWSEGQLSRSRARLVNAHSLEEVARDLELGSHLRLGKGEEKTGGRDKPALLADAFEAVVAAIYLDGGLDAARQFLRRTLFRQTFEHGGEGLADSDRKSALQEFLQARGRPPAEYKIAAESGPDHHKMFHVEVWVNGEPLAAGSGSTKKEAEQLAAREALQRLEASEPKEG